MRSDVMVVDEASPMLADVMWLQMVFAQNGQDPERCPINAMLKTQRKKIAPAAVPVKYR
jgi:hypothetical protein